MTSLGNQIKVTAQQDLTETNQVINGNMYSICFPLRMNREVDFFYIISAKINSS